VLNIDFLTASNKNIAIIIRHADREHITPGKNEDEPLNETGKINSIRFGEKLSIFNGVKIFTSPVGRCIQTGEAIIKGFQKQGCISQSNILGEPGPFVLDGQLAGQMFNEFGTKCIVEKQIAGEKIIGIRPLADGCKLLKNYIVSKMNMKIEGNILIFISHDAIIAPFIYKYTREKFGRENWLDFLDGITLMKENKNILFIRNGKKFYEMARN